MFTFSNTETNALCSRHLYLSRVKGALVSRGTALVSRREGVVPHLFASRRVTPASWSRGHVVSPESEYRSYPTNASDTLELAGLSILSASLLLLLQVTRRGDRKAEYINAATRQYLYVDDWFILARLSIFVKKAHDSMVQGLQCWPRVEIRIGESCASEYLLSQIDAPLRVTTLHVL